MQCSGSQLSHTGSLELPIPHFPAPGLLPDLPESWALPAGAQLGSKKLDWVQVQSVTVGGTKIKPPSSEIISYAAHKIQGNFTSLTYSSAPHTQSRDNANVSQSHVVKITVIQPSEWKRLKAQPGGNQQNKPKTCFQSRSKLTWNKEIHTLNNDNEASYWNQSLATLLFLSVHWKIFKWDRKYRVQDSQKYEHSMDPDISYIWMLGLPTQNCCLWGSFVYVRADWSLQIWNLAELGMILRVTGEDTPGTKYTPQ